MGNGDESERRQSVINYGAVETQVIIQGSAHITHVLPLPRQIGRPRKHNLPLPNPDFVGRSDELDRIHTLLAPGLPVAPGQRTARPGSLTGLGGVGKTQLAIEYAWHNAELYGLLLWVDAEGTGLQTSFAALAEDPLALGLDSNVSLQDRVRAVKAHLEVPSDLPHLLILDNVDDAMAWRSIVPAGNTRVLLTTRIPHLSGVGSLTLDVLDVPDAIELLLGRRADLDEAAIEALALCDRLGRLPLAVYVAGRLLATGIWTLGDLLKRIDEDAITWSEGASVTDMFKQQPSLRRLFDASVERLIAGEPADRLALQLLDVCGWFASTPIPCHVLFQAAAGLSGQAVDDEAWRRGLARLLSVGLVRINGQGFPVFHQLVAEYSRARRGVEGQLAVLDCLGDVAARTRTDSVSLLALNELSEHLDIACANMPAASPKAHLWIVARYAQLLANVGEYSRSVSICKTALSQATDNETSAALLHTAALALRHLGRHDEALACLHRDLEMTVHCRGAEHREVAVSLQALGRVIGESGNPHEAMRYFVRAAKILQKAGEPTDVAIAVGLCEMGTIAHELGDFPSAVRFYEDALRSQRLYWNDDHQEVASTFLGLSRSLAALGDAGNAQAFALRAVAILRTLYGANHPDVAAALSALALAHRRLSQHTECMSCLEDALDIQQRFLGRRHLSVAVTLSLIAQTHALLGNLDEAIRLSERALAIKLDLLPAGHREIATGYVDLGRFMLRRGDAQGADLMRRGVQSLTEALGADHPVVRLATSWLPKRA